MFWHDDTLPKSKQSTGGFNDLYCEVKQPVGKGRSTAQQQEGPSPTLPGSGQPCTHEKLCFEAGG